jgi:hypothetical protein
MVRVRAITRPHRAFELEQRGCSFEIAEKVAA